MKKASIDIGSNTTLLLAGEFDNGELVEEFNESVVTALGKDLDKNKFFCEESMNETRNALTHYVNLLKNSGYSLSDVIVTATEASRVATNAEEFYKSVSKDLGLKFNIISSQGEAYYTAKGVAFGASDEEDELIIMDIGGASTEFVKLSLSPFNIKESISLPVGVVRANDWISENILDQKLKSIFEEFNISSFKSSVLVGVAGTLTSIAGIKNKLKVYDKKKVHGEELALDEILKIKSELENYSSEEILNEYPFLGKRAKVIVSGLDLVSKIGIMLDVDKFKVSSYGLRYGTLTEGVIDGRYLTRVIE